MLTLDLLRYRIDGETVAPIYLTTTGGRKYLDAAERIIALYRSHVGRTIGELDSAVDSELAAATDYKVYRGLAKTLNNYAVIEPASSLDAEETRRTLFTLAAQGPPLVRSTDLLFTHSAREKLASMAAQMGVSEEELATSLYSDLPENHLLSAMDQGIDAVGLIQRYNTALAQAMLYRATKMIVDVYDNYRGVFTHIKLARLMHSIEPRDGGYRVHIDGPLSLFANVERYGVAMARVLPAILKCGKWRLAAKVNLPEGSEKLFRLSPRQGLSSHYAERQQFDSAPEEAFYHKFARAARKWSIRREGSVLDLKDSVLIPDFEFTHRDGCSVHLEIVGYWTPEYLRRKLDKLSRVREANVLVAVPDALSCSEEEFPARVIRYKGRLLINQVLPALEEFRERSDGTGNRRD